MKFPYFYYISLIGLLFNFKKSKAQCMDSGFLLEGLNDCSFDTVLAAYIPIFDDPVNSGGACSGTTAEADLINILTSRRRENSRSEAEAALKAKCATGYDNYKAKVPFHEIPGYGESFIAKFFNGGTHWNQNHETMYPSDVNGNPTNVLSEDAEQVMLHHEGKGRYGLTQWPDHLPNFSDCQMNSAYCCWTSDRQANDNNGNCETPYDENCVDADPADNTDLCFVDLEDGATTRGASESGFFIFPNDDHDHDNYKRAEGPVHCHGLGWTDDVSDPSSIFKGNNLFFVSMYDHLYQRGYVRNVPGAPMCACAEQMPVVSRADCTQVDVEHSFKFQFDGENVLIIPTKIEIDFNSCQGYDRYGKEDNNDLWSYMNRLYVEDKISSEKLIALNEKLVGDEPNMCPFAINKRMAEKGYKVGHSSSWTKVAGREAMNMEVPLGKFKFELLLNESESNMIHRVCPSCYASHKYIYYKRLTTIPDDLDLLENLKSSYEMENGNTWNVDFQMFSSFEDAVAGRNAWLCPEGGYVYDDGFPGMCSPDGELTYDQGSVFEWGLWSSQQDVAWFVDSSSPFTPLPSDVVGEKPDWFEPEITSSMDEANGKLYMLTNAHDIWGENDNIHFYSEEFDGDFEAIVRLEKFNYLQEWSKVGIMVREEKLEPSSRYFSILSSGANGMFSQWRNMPNEHNDANHKIWDGSIPFEGPVWMRLLKQGDVFSSYTSSDGNNWELNKLVEIQMSGPLHVGLGLTAHGWNEQVAEAIFTDYSITSFDWPSSAPTLTNSPTTYNIDSFDVGSVEIPGAASYATNSAKYVLNGSGWVGGEEDAFHFAPTQKTGDFTITAYIASFSQPVNYAMCGIMIRGSRQDARDPFTGCFLQHEHGLFMFSRKSYSLHTEHGENTNWHQARYSGWCKLTKVGTMVTGYRSIDGMNWEELDTVEIDFPTDTVQVGPVTTGKWNQLGTAVIENFNIS